MPEKHYRSFVKAISWRFTGSIDTLIIGYFVTGKLKYAVSIMSIEFFTKIALFYFHERAWHKIPLGMIREPNTKDNYDI